MDSERVVRRNDQSKEVQETKTNFGISRDLRYIEGTPRDMIDRASHYLRTLDNGHDMNISIAKYLRGKNNIKEEDITYIQNIIHSIIKYKSDKYASQGIEAIINTKYSEGTPLKTTIDWLAKGTPGRVSERERIEQQYQKLIEKKDNSAKDAIYGLRNQISILKGNNIYEDEVKIKLEKAQKYFCEALGIDRHQNFKDIFKGGSEIPNNINPAYALEEVFNLVADFDLRTNIGEYHTKLRDLLR